MKLEFEEVETNNVGDEFWPTKIGPIYRARVDGGWLYAYEKSIAFVPITSRDKNEANTRF